LRRFPLIFAFALAAPLFLANLAAAEPAGTVVRLRGEASADASGQSRALAVNAPIEIGDRLHTGSGARLEVKLLDGTDITLGEKADFTIDRLSLSEDQGIGLFTRAAGALRLVGGDITKKPEHKLEVASNVGTIGIRGTDFWGGAIKPGSLLDVFLIEGAVEVRTPGGTVVLDKPGLGTSITRQGAAPLAPNQWAAALRDRAIATVSFDAP
jgi:hypothetical protein